MAARKSKEPKQRIMDVAISLFAQKGYAGVGVREIASEADVNIAMISYYFEGKLGILKAIIEEFFCHYSEILSDIDDQSKSPEECVRLMVQRLVNFVKKNTELAMVTYNELPLDSPEIAEMKAEKIKELIQRISGLIRRFGLDPSDTFHIAVIGPSLIASILTNFRFRPVLKRIIKVEFNDAYHERLIETISALFLFGVHGIAAQKRKRRK
ncbi:MAG: TetR/AcrR family transcriptional regulator [Candidatus Aminicenantes bacterium]|nr:MAG: TetR/AcrR family transcriptional regulator [Candidatus Aminicenantes bacterium]